MFIEAGSAHVVHKALTIRDLSKGLWLKHKIGEIQLWVNKSATSNGLNVKQPQAQHAQAGLHWELQSCDSLANWRSCPKFRTNSFRCSCLSMSQYVSVCRLYLHVSACIYMYLQIYKGCHCTEAPGRTHRHCHLRSLQQRCTQKPWTAE